MHFLCIKVQFHFIIIIFLRTLMFLFYVLSCKLNLLIHDYKQEFSLCVATGYLNK